MGEIKDTDNKLIFLEARKKGQDPDIDFNVEMNDEERDYYVVADTVFKMTDATDNLIDDLIRKDRTLNKGEVREKLARVLASWAAFYQDYEDYFINL